MSCSTQNSKKSRCSSVKDVADAKSLSDLVKHYKDNHSLDLDEWRQDISIPEAVFGDSSTFAGEFPFKPEKKDIDWDVFKKKVHVNPHQSRIPKDRLQKIAEHLAANWNRDSFKDFEDLYDYIKSILVISPSNTEGVVKNPHALIIYDIALRLARRFGVWPEKYVYLNGKGPFEGAKALGLGKYIKDRKILYSDIIKHYPELKELDAAELENFLCWYYSQLNRFNKL